MKSEFMWVAKLRHFIFCWTVCLFVCSVYSHSPHLAHHFNAEVFNSALLGLRLCCFVVSFAMNCILIFLIKIPLAHGLCISQIDCNLPSNTSHKIKTYLFFLFTCINCKFSPCHYMPSCNNWFLSYLS